MPTQDQIWNQYLAEKSTMDWPDYLEEAVSSINAMAEDNFRD